MLTKNFKILAKTFGILAKTFKILPKYFSWLYFDVVVTGTQVTVTFPTSVNGISKSFTEKKKNTGEVGLFAA